MIIKILAATGLLLSLLLVFLVYFFRSIPLNAVHSQTIPDADYLKALKETDPANFKLPEAGSPEEKAMVDRVFDLFFNYTVDNLRQNFSQVYADGCYFRDAFHQMSDVQKIEDYLIAGLEPLDDCEFVFSEHARVGGDFYFRWTMRLKFKKSETGAWEESIGMSHFRFNDEGKVIFHQDYWDPSDVLYKRIPIANRLIAYVKAKL